MIMASGVWTRMGRRICAGRVHIPMKIYLNLPVRRRRRRRIV
jgi:hypothetical protein